MLVICIVQSSKAFVWSLALIVLVLYVVGVYITHLVLAVRVDNLDTDFVSLERWYSNVPRTVLSLFQGLTGGVDWDDITRPLMESVSPWIGVFFFLYMAFAIILVLNVVTATFVEASIERAGKVHELEQLSHASKLFKSLDRDGSGYITLDELEDHLECIEVQNFFQSIDVDVGEARAVFKVLDVDDTNTIEFWEFLTGCLRLQGPAKSIDLVLGIYHIDCLVERLLEGIR